MLSYWQGGWHGFGVWKHDRKLDYQSGHFMMWIAAGVITGTAFWYYYFPDMK